MGVVVGGRAPAVPRNTAGWPFSCACAPPGTASEVVLDAAARAAYHCRMRRLPAVRLSLVVGVLTVACALSAPGRPPSRVGDLPWQDTPEDRLVLQARGEFERGRPRAALDALQPVLTAAPGHVDAARLRQDILRDRGRRGLLLVEAQRRLAAAPDDARAHYLAGRLVLDRAQKITHFQRARELAPGSVWGWLGLAHAMRPTDPEQAVEIYERLYYATDRHPLVGVALAATLREGNQPAAAAPIYEAMRGDPRVPGIAALGLAQVALLTGDREGAFGALLEALSSRPFDPGVRGLLLGYLETGLRDDRVAQVFDLLREVPDRLADLSAGDGAAVAAVLLQRTGQWQAMRGVLEQRRVDVRRPELRRLQRRLLLSLGDVPAFLATVRADVPEAVVAVETNEVRGRWLALLRGPFHAAEPLATPESAAALLAALRDVGWLVEAELLAEAALRRHATAPALVAIRDEVRRELAFEAGLRRLIYQGYEQGDTAELAVVVERIRQLSGRVFGRDVVGQPARFAAPLVGEMLDPFRGDLAQHLARYNKHLVLGRRAGGTAEGLLLTRLSVGELPAAPELVLPGRCFEVIGIDRDVRSLGGVLGGDLAGVALLNHFLVDYDAVRDWARGVADRRRIVAEDGNELLADPLPEGAGDDPLDVAWRLAVLSPVPDADLELAVLDTIRHHERQHLVDSFFYLPVETNLWRSLGLVLAFGFSPSAIEAEMERRAELASLAVSPHTELVLAHIADFLGEEVPGSPHHRGFGQLGRELCQQLVAAGLAPAAAVPSRWHQVPMVAVRRAARQLLGELPAAGALPLPR